MSSLEERREARRRKRMQQEENGVNCDQISADLEERLARRRREREERLKIIAAGVSAINGEDEFERRRRERREERLSDDGPSADKRAGEEGGEETTTSSRRSRRRGTEEELDTTETTSYRSRRRRGGDDEDSYSAPAPEPEPEVDEEALRRQQEQEEEEARQRAEAEEIRRQQQEEERQRAQEAARRRAEEEERQRRDEDEEVNEDNSKEEYFRNNNDEKESTNLYIDEENLQSKSQVKQIKTNSYETKLRNKSEENTHTKPNNKDAQILTSVGKADKLKSFFEKKKDSELVNGEQTNSTSSKKPIEDQSLKQVKEQLIKFESSLHQTESVKDTKREQRKQEVRLLAPGNDRLKDIQKRFQGDGTTVNGSSSSRLGRFSASDMSINSSSQSPRDIRGKPSVTGRWQTALDRQKEKEVRSFRSSTSSLNEEETDETAVKRSEKISRLSAKFKNNDESDRNDSLSPRDKMSPVRRQWSLSSDASSDGGSAPIPKRRTQSSVINRWQHDQLDSSMNNKRPLYATSAGNTPNRSIIDSRTLSLDRSDNLAKTRNFIHQMEEEERLERERLEQEEREREEAIRLEEERIEQEKLDAERAIREEREREEEEEKRQLVERAARRMEEEKKKKKRKGLGGLSPEKKKMLKDDDVIIDDDDDDDGEEKENLSWHEEEKHRILKERIGTLPDLDSMDREGLQRICKKLFAKLAELNEEVYDWEAKIKKQDFEINELTLKVNDTKGKFMKPMLRKVNKTESKLEKIHRKDKDKSDFRDTLKSTGQNKFSLEDEEKEDGKQDWRDNLKKSGEQDEDVSEAVTLQAES